MTDKCGIYLPQSERESEAAKLLEQSVSGYAAESEVIDFNTPSQLAAAIRRSEFSTVIVAVPENAFLKAKIAFFKALGVKTVRSSAITAAVGEDCPLSEKEIEIHSAVPDGAKAFVTADGLFSAFTYEQNNKKYIMLPLEVSRLKALLPLLNLTADAASDYKKSLAAIIATKKKIAVAPEGLSEVFMSVVSSVEGGKDTFILSSVSGKSENPDSANAEFAKCAKENTKAEYGVAVSEVETDPESGESFIYVSLADSERAKVARVFAEENEDAKHLAGAAVIKLCEMLEELAGAGALINPDAPTEKKQKKNPVLPIIITAIGLAVAVIIALLVSLFAGQKTDHSEPTTAAGNAFLQEQSPAVHAFAEGTTVTLPVTEMTLTVPSTKTEEETDFRGGSGIGEEIELTQSETLPEATTEKTSATAAPTKPVTAAPTVLATTDAPKPTAALTQKPTQAPTQKPTVPPTTASKHENLSGKFVFTTYGWGHGVGMSQEGAISMAKNGKDYKQILAAYYPGTTLKPDSSAPETVSYGGVDYGLVEYLCKTSYREIGNGAPEEAIKAQIVAVYTFAKTYNFNVDSSRHAFSANWAYENTATHKACLEILGMADASDAPKAVYVDYNGAPAFTCYFASSAGKTASASSVWGGTYNYLSGGVTSPEAVETATVEISAEEMKKLIEAYDSGIVLGDDPSQWIKIVSHDGAYNGDIGYVSVVRIGNKEIRGNKFRGEVCDYRLRSHCFTVKYIK